MPWVYLLIASVFEVSWAIGLKYSVGLTKPAPTVFTIVSMLLSFWFLALAAKTLPIGTAYAVWTGIGAVGTVSLGILLFHEPSQILRLFFILLIIIGIIGVKLTSAD